MRVKSGRDSLFHGVEPDIRFVVGDNENEVEFAQILNLDGCRVSKHGQEVIGNRAFRAGGPAYLRPAQH